MTRPAKRPTSSDVAREAGVSQTTVSFVLNNRRERSIPEQTRRRVLEAARRLNYRPHASARNLAMGRSDIVLLSVPAVPIGSGISRFIEGLATSLADHGLTLVTHLAGAHSRPLVDVCAGVGASAVIGFEAFHPDTVAALHLAGADVVIPSDTDNASATRPIGRLQAEHLISRGHRLLGYALPDHPLMLPMAEERLRGATEACQVAGVDAPVVARTGLDVTSAADAVSRWTAAAVTGVCAFNDDTAIAVLAGMREHNLTAPADLAVIGADDIPIGRLVEPPLTTLAFDMDQVVRRRTDAVVTRLRDRESDHPSAWLTPSLIRRAST